MVSMWVTISASYKCVRMCFNRYVKRRVPKVEMKCRSLFCHVIKMRPKHTHVQSSGPTTPQCTIHTHQLVCRLISTTYTDDAFSVSLKVVKRILSKTNKNTTKRIDSSVRVDKRKHSKVPSTPKKHSRDSEETRKIMCKVRIAARPNKSFMFTLL